MSFDYDLFVIGAGSGGGARGAHERKPWRESGGGGRISRRRHMRYSRLCAEKLFVYASHFAEEFEDAAGFGWTVADAKFDWPTLVKNKNAEIDRLNGIYIKNP